MSTTQERSNNPERGERNRGGRNRRGGDRSGDRSGDRNRRNNNDGRRRNNQSSRSSNRSSESRSVPRTPRVAPLTLGQQIIRILTFGLVTPTPKRKPKPISPTAKAKAKAESKSSSSSRADRPERNGGATKSASRREPRESRKPELREVTSGRLYVGNLSYDANESDLMDLFKGIGQVQSAEVVSHKRTMRSKGYAFVQMLSLDEAKRAVSVLHDKDFMGRPLVVSGAKAERPSSQYEKSETAEDTEDTEDTEVTQPTES
ncbi:MAG: hypothetical protein ACI9R3_003924 [Verrucomicrobiales bacterium]|jgi:hypothetical protein